MRKCKKGLTIFKGKVRKKLRLQRRELKARLEYAGRLNKENNKIVEDCQNATKKMQSIINDLDQQVSRLNQDLHLVEDERSILLYDIEQERNDIVDLEKDNTKLTLKNKDLETALSICRNRIKYEFRGQ